MKLYFINQHFPPDVAPTGRLISELAHKLKAEFNIHVLTDFPSYHNTDLKLKKNELWEGIEITRFGNSSPGREKTQSRFLGYALFLTRAFFFVVFNVRSNDIVVTLTTPPFAGFLGWVAKKLKGSKFIYWGMDLHPEAEVAVGWVSENSFMHKVLKAIHSKILVSADTIVVLGEFMKQRMLTEYPTVLAEKVEIIPTWEKSTEGKLTEEKYPIFTVNYSGNLGLVHDIEFFKQVILSLKDHSDVHFTFSGSGPSQEDLKTFLIQHHVSNVEFISYQDTLTHRQHLKSSHLNWFSLKSNCGGIAVPSKLAPYLLSGNPVLFCGPAESEPFEFIAKHDCGKAFLNQEYTKAVEFILEIKDSVSLRNRFATKTRNATIHLPALEQIVVLWFTVLRRYLQTNDFRKM